VVIENYPEGQVEELDAVNNPEDPGAGSRKIPFGRELWIEQSDFMEEPSSKYFRLSPGAEVRLRWAYVIKCTGVVKNEAGEVVELRCTYDPATRSSNPTDRKIKGTIHWVSAQRAVPAELRLYEHLFTMPKPDEADDWKQNVNPHSLEVVQGMVEPSLADAAPATRYQFERTGYFVVDADSRPGHLVLNRTVTLRDTWGKIEKQEASVPTR
jgi:glutaminyl-tRNA synthetase